MTGDGTIREVGATGADPGGRPSDSAGRRIESYLTDLETIRELMQRYEEQSIVRPWTFGAWGTLVIAGSLINWTAWLALSIDAPRALLTVWLPVLTLGGLAEMLGYLSQKRISGAALLTRRTARLMAAYLGLVVVIGILVVESAPTGLSAGALLAIGAAPILVYAQLTYATLFVEGFALLALAVVLQATGVREPAALLAAGLAAGLGYWIAGVRTRLRERRASHASRQADGRHPPAGDGPAAVEDSIEWKTRSEGHRARDDR